MNERFSMRVRAAAVAGWWTILVFIAYLTVAWLIWLAVIHARPEWLRQLWGGGGLDWPTMQTIWIFGIFKAVMLTAVLVALWLTFWARRLKKAET